MLRVETVVFLKKEHIHWLSNAKWSVLKIYIYTSNLILNDEVIFINTYVDIYVSIIINE